MDKDYYSKSLEGILRKYITYDRYGDFTAIVQDIFQRRAYEFSFSDEQMEAEARNFIARCKSIEFEATNGATYMGCYSPSDSKIVINQDYYQRAERSLSPEEFGTKMFATLTHEIYHAITDKGSDLGLTFYNNKKQQWEGTALNEVFTETATNRACKSRGTREAEMYRAETDGYPNITFAVNLLAASVGLSEKEILRAGIKDRSALYQAMSTKFASRRDFNQMQSYMFAPMEAALDVVYNMCYNPEKFQDMSMDMKTQLMESSLVSLYDNCFRMAAFQISRDPRGATMEHSAEVTYRFLKMQKIMEDSMDRLHVTEDMRRNILSQTEGMRELVERQALGLDLLSRERNNIENPIAFNSFLQSAKNGNLQDRIDELQRAGIYVPNFGSAHIRDVTDNLDFARYVMREDFDEGRQWDNEAAAIVMQKVFREYRIRNGLIDPDYDPYKTDEVPIIDEDLEDTEEIPTVDDPDKTEELPTVDNPGKTEEIPTINDPDKTEEIPTVDDPDKTEELPTVDDPDKTEELPTVDDPNKTEELPTVDDSSKTEGHPLTVEEIKVDTKNNIFSKFKEGIKNIIRSFNNRNLKKLSEKTEQQQEEVSDNSGYYASLVSNEFDRKYRVEREDLIPMEEVKKEGRKTVEKNRDGR